jgi:HK97 family phage portal protein
MLPGDHWRLTHKNGRERVKNSALSRILRTPNGYQSKSDFLLNLVRGLYQEGNAYALALRNDRYEIAELHLMNPLWSRPYVSGADGEVFYTLGGNQVIAPLLMDQPLLVPQRDVLHVRLHSSVRQPWPLLGDTPLSACWGEVITNQMIVGQQASFYGNQARPSAVLMTEQKLDMQQTQYARDRWFDVSKGMAAGGTAILTQGMKAVPWTTNAKDAQLAEVLKLTEEHIALAYRIPLQVLGIAGHEPRASTELMMQSWIATGLGFALNHVEEAFDRLFRLKGQPEEYTEFDTKALLRSAIKDRLEALTRGVQGGIYAPNEARNEEGLPSVPYGDEPRVQQQVVPLSQVGKIPAAPPAHAPGAPPPAAPALPPPSKPPEPPQRDYSDDLKRERKVLRVAATRAGRRYFT